MTDFGPRYEPFDFQVADINNLLAHDSTGFVVAETGAGKSLIGTEVGLRSGARVILVIAPLGTVEDVWREGILRQDPSAIVRMVNGSEPGKEAFSDLQLGEPGWYIMTPNIFTKWDMRGVEPELTIVDEAHLLSARGNVGARTLLKLKSKRRIVMSGTMVRNKIENFWVLLRWVYPELDGVGQLADQSFNRWCKTWLEFEYDHFAPTKEKVIGEKNPGAIAQAIPCYIQHFKRAECCEFHPKGFLENLPAPVEITYAVELTPNQRKAIKRMEEEYVAWLDVQAAEAVRIFEEEGRVLRRALNVKMPMVARMRLRQMTLGMPSFIQTDRVNKETGEFIEEIGFAPDCESPKLDLFEKRLEATIDEPYLALTSSEKFAEEATRRLQAKGIAAEKWSGKVSSKKRDEIKERFTSGETRVVVGVIEAISTGIDGLQYATNRLFWFDQSDDLTSNIQTEGRADRRGQTRQVINEKAVANGSMDRKIYDVQITRRFRLNKSLRRELEKKAKVQHDRSE